MDGARIKALRKKMGLTLQCFSNTLEVALTTVCGWEKNRFKPNMKNLEILEELCKVHDV